MSNQSKKYAYGLLDNGFSSEDINKGINVLRSRQITMASNTKEFEKVYCFEPNAIFRECFLKNLPQDNIKLFTYGLSDREHTATQSFNSTVIQDIPGNVECRPLDSFFLSDIDFIKIDVDGFEIQVLSGAIKTLQENNPVINIEMKRNKRPAIVAESERILRSVGYCKKDCVKSDEIWLKSL